MVTQEMKNSGIHCKGQGFNCPNCLNKLTCVEFVNVDVKLKTPLGIEPKFIVDERRKSDIVGAINIYIQSNMKIPVEWVEEYNDLISNMKADK